MKAYKPSLKEICKEACIDVYKLIATTGRIAIFPYRIPTAIRQSAQYLDKKEEEKIDIFTDEPLAAFRMIGGVASLFGSGLFLLYNATAQKGHPEVLLIPIITNILSGLYENGRVKAIEKQSMRKNLEKKI